MLLIKLFKQEFLMVLEFGLYNAFWFLLAYFIPRQNNIPKNKSFKSLYWIYLLITSVQLILPLTDLSHDLYLYFYLKILLLSSLGILIDSVLTFFSYFSFFRKTKFIPPWLVLLWVSFATTLQYGLFFMSHAASNLFFLGLLGAFGFPLTYFFADRLKVLKVNNPWPTYFYQGLLWGVFLPLTQLF